MPFPREPVVVEGGCFCSAIRYRVSVPAWEDRPFYPGRGAETDPPARMPVITSDHCNDCRAATGSILPHWFGAPLATVSVSLVDIAHAHAPRDGRLSRDTQRRPWQPAEEIFKATDSDPLTSLVFFASTEGHRRSFCGRCGTPLTYLFYPPVEGLQPETLDIVLGTVDRKYLEGEKLSPDSQFWWSLGIDWVQSASTQGYKVPRHPNNKVDEEVGGQA